MKCAVRDCATRLLPGTMMAILVTSPVNAATYFGLVSNGELYASMDAGNSWNLRGLLPVSDAVALAAGMSATQLMMASESGTFYRSTDAGVTWTAVGVVPASDVTALVSYPGRVLLLTRTGGVYSSVDAGASFTGTGVITASDVVSATQLEGNIYAATETGSVYRSGDNGATWTAVGGVTASDVVGIASLGASLCVMTSTGDIARSLDSGATWTYIAAISQSGMTALTLATNILLAATGAGEVVTSTNGTTWAWRGTMNQVTVRALATDIPTGTAVPGLPGTTFGFLGPRPNPARTSMPDLAFNLVEPARVTTRVFDVGGHEVAVPMVSEPLGAGETLRTWRPGSLPGGTYFVRATIGDRVETRKLLYGGPP